MKSKLKDGSQSQPMSRKSSACFRLFPKVKLVGSGTGISPLYLNVYDLTPLNGYFFWAGIGAFHSGVEVHGVEYGFGAHDFPSSGVFEVEPRQCPGFKFRKSIFIGTTHLNPMEVRKFMEHLSVNYHGDSYHLIGKNCNHFTGDVCYKLTGRRIPKWVNRLARIGSLCHCLLPDDLNETTLTPVMDIQVSDSENNKLRSPLLSMHDNIVNPVTDIHVCDSEKKKPKASRSLNSSPLLHQKKEVSPSSLILPSHVNSCVPPLDLKHSGTLKGTPSNFWT